MVELLADKDRSVGTYGWYSGIIEIRSIAGGGGDPHPAFGQPLPEGEGWGEGAPRDIGRCRNSSAQEGAVLSGTRLPYLPIQPDP